MILVTGATGHLGRLVIATLLKTLPATEIVAAVRDPAKAEDLAALGIQIRQADYDQPAAWDAALAGIDKVLLISSNELGKRAAQHRMVIAAVQRAGVELLVYTSVLHADSSPLGLAKEHLETEAAIRASGIPFVLLRNGWYHENYTESLSAALQHGAILGSAGEGQISSAARADYAEAAAKALTGENQDGRTYELAGDTSYTLTELAAKVADQSGKTVIYRNLPQADYQKALEGVGLPEPIAAMLADSDFSASQGALFDESQQLSQLIGRPTTPIDAAVAVAV